MKKQDLDFVTCGNANGTNSWTVFHNHASLFLFCLFNCAGSVLEADRTDQTWLYLSSLKSTQVCVNVTIMCSTINTTSRSVFNGEPRGAVHFPLWRAAGNWDYLAKVELFMNKYSQRKGSKCYLVFIVCHSQPSGLRTGNIYPNKSGKDMMKTESRDWRTLLPHEL